MGFWKTASPRPPRTHRDTKFSGTTAEAYNSRTAFTRPHPEGGMQQHSVPTFRFIRGVQRVYVQSCFFACESPAPHFVHSLMIGPYPLVDVSRPPVQGFSSPLACSAHSHNQEAVAVKCGRSRDSCTSNVIGSGPSSFSFTSPYSYPSPFPEPGTVVQMTKGLSVTLGMT